jgi:hypothetical protein
MTTDHRDTKRKIKALVVKLIRECEPLESDLLLAQS